MARRKDAFTFTYSKKNSDVKDLIEQKANDPNFVKTDFFCEAVRFYEKYKDTAGMPNEQQIKDLVIDVLKDIDIEAHTAEKITNQIKVSSELALDEIEDDWMKDD